MYEPDTWYSDGSLVFLVKANGMGCVPKACLPVANSQGQTWGFKTQPAVK